MVGKTVLKRDPETQMDDFRRASPLHRIHAEAPPFLTIHGTSDGLAAIEEARAFAQMLQTTSQSPAAFVELPGTQHAFEVFHSLRTRSTVLAVSRFLGWSLAQSK
jgi:acetyl esterase/lipase